MQATRRRCGVVPVHNTTAMQAVRLQQERRDQAFIEEHTAARFAANLHEANAASESRAVERRAAREKAYEERERQMEETVSRMMRDRTVRAEEQEQEERLGHELERLRLSKIKDEKERQQVRETSIELRELEAQLRAAYTSKERMAQMAEKEALRYDEISRNATIAHEMKEEHDRAVGAFDHEQREKANEDMRYKMELEKQLEEQELRKQAEYDVNLKDKLMVDEIVRKIHEEDQRELERSAEKQRITKAYMNEFLAQRDDWKAVERDRLEDENRRIAGFAALQAARENDRMEEKRKQDDYRDELIHRLSEKMAKEQRDREEMEEVRIELSVEEQEVRDRQKEQAERERKLAEKEDLQRVEREQRHYKAMRQQAQHEEEENFKKMMLAKFADDDRIEQMNAQKRRMKQLEHKRAVEKLLEERQQQYAIDRVRAEEERLELEATERHRRQLISEERARLLGEHAPGLLGYLPKGVIRNSEDLQNLGSEFKNYYGKKPNGSSDLC